MNEAIGIIAFFVVGVGIYALFVMGDALIEALSCSIDDDDED